MEDSIGCKIGNFQTESNVIMLHKHPNKSVLFKLFHLLSTNPKLISQYRLTYTLYSGLKAVFYCISQKDDLYNKTLPSNHSLIFFLNITDHCHFLICNMFLHDLACFFFLTCSDRIHKLFMLIQQYNMVICILYIFQTITVELFS